MKKFRVIGLITCIMLLTMAFTMPIQAADPPSGGTTHTGPTTFVFNFWMDENGSFVYIGDKDIVGEMQLNLDQLGNQILSLDSRINNAQETANDAYYSSREAIVKALENKGILMEHDDTLVLQYNQLTDTVDKLWVLRDEVVAFEGHYFDYVNETGATLDEHNKGIFSNSENTDKNEGEIKDLKNQYKNLKANWNLLFLILCLIGGGFLAYVIYVISKRHQAKRKFLAKRTKQPSLVAFMPPVKKNKKPSIRHAHIRVRKIRVNKRKSPTLHIRRNPERSPIRFLLTLFHKL